MYSKKKKHFKITIWNVILQYPPIYEYKKSKDGNYTFSGWKSKMN